MQADKYFWELYQKIHPVRNERELTDKILNEWYTLVNAYVQIDFSITYETLTKDFLSLLQNYSQEVSQKINNEKELYQLSYISEAIFKLVHRKFPRKRDPDEELNKVLESLLKGQISGKEFSYSIIEKIDKTTSFEIKTLPEICKKELFKHVQNIPESYEEITFFPSSLGTIYNLLTDCQKEKEASRKLKESWHSNMNYISAELKE